jgi:peptidoglycan/LPS O-acetylase OafA/YrhL
VDAFLSWKIFVPLSRLTYCAYLCQYVVLLINVGSSRVPAYLSGYTVVHEFAGNLLFILVLAVAISLALEMPFINLDRILIKRHPHGTDHTPKAEGTDQDPAAMAAPQTSIILDDGVRQEDKSSVANVYVTSKSYENKAFVMCQ